MSMNHDLFNILPGLENLLRKKSFVELDQTELDSVLQYLSEDEYEELRTTLHTVEDCFRSEEKSIKPSIRLNPALTGALLTKDKKNNLLSQYPVLNILKKPIPAYQVVLLMTLFFIIVIFYRMEDKNFNQPVPVADNKFEEVKIVETDTGENSPPEAQHLTATAQKKSKKRHNYIGLKEKENNLPDMNIIEKENRKMVLNNIEITSFQKKGKNISAEPNLIKFLVTAN